MNKLMRTMKKVLMPSAMSDRAISNVLRQIGRNFMNESCQLKVPAKTKDDYGGKTVVYTNSGSAFNVARGSPSFNMLRLVAESVGSVQSYSVMAPSDKTISTGDQLVFTDVTLEVMGPFKRQYGKITRYLCVEVTS